MINFKIEILNPKTKSYEVKPSAVFTPKFANILDEQLDEATITLKGDTTAYYEPFTRVKVTITNTPECKVTQSMYEEIRANAEQTINQWHHDADTLQLTETKLFFMFIANDRAIEVPVGSGLYNHDIYLIELTKITERYICDSITFTNSLGNSYLDNQQKAFAIDKELTGYSEVPNIDDLVFDTYKTPLNPKGSFTVLSLNTVASKIISYLEDYNNYTNAQVTSYGTVNGNNIYSGITIDNGGVISTIGGEAGFNNFNETAIITPKNPLKLTYVINIGATNSGGSTVVFPYSFTYYFNATNNRLPLKKWTITDVINRACDLVEPLEVVDGTTQTPKFYLNSKQKTKYANILAPEFSFTTNTFREILQTIGGFIHAEPRIISESNGRYEIFYDEYGSNVYSKIASEPYITATYGTDINQYCTAIESNADNLTNTLDWAQGVIVEPFYDYYKTLRTEQTTARMAEDDGTHIATQYPISKLGADKKVICKFIPGVGEGEWDITPYVFEESDYLTLSSYEGAYPFSKAYAIYYKQGQKNIKGLFFKAEHAVNPIFHRYAIVNILRAVTGNADLEISGQNLMLLSFTVTYLPFYGARIRTHKQLIQDGLASVLAYNQGANAIETRYYGENLKGVVERMGNVEKTYTYNLPFISHIPKVGTKFDKNYYISNVSYELYPAHIKCTVALSKHFNRKSEYVGINSQKRMYEISEKQSQIRQTLYPLYIVVSDNEIESDDNLSGAIKYPCALLFNEGNTSIVYPVTTAYIECYDINKNLINQYSIRLPVIASALANSMIFNYAFEDNYSAGQKAVYITGDETDEDDVTGYWGAYVPYTDYYGRVYYIDVTLQADVPNKGTNAYLDLPQGVLNIGGSKTLTQNRYLYRKDNREIPQITHEIAVVTDNENIIIGSALCRNCGAVNVSSVGYKLYAFTKPLNLLESQVDLTNAVEVTSGITVNSESLVLNFGNLSSSTYKAWAIVTEQTTTTIAVSDESGTEETTQNIISGGEILIGENLTETLPQTRTLYFATKRKIYD